MERFIRSTLGLYNRSLGGGHPQDSVSPHFFIQRLENQRIYEFDSAVPHIVYIDEYKQYFKYEFCSL